MKRILTIGCSYSALYYHPNPKYSYTYLLKEKLGFDELINLGTGGLSPDGCFRLLSNYLNNPVVGKPDFIFIQFPSADRCEVFPDESMVKDNISEENWHLIGRTAFRGKSALLDNYEPNKRWTNVNWTDETYKLTEDDLKDITLITEDIRPFEDRRNHCLYVCPEIVLRLFPSISEEFFSTTENHKLGFDRNVYYKLLADPRQATVNYAKNLALVEQLCETHKIDYAYIDTDYSYVDAGVEPNADVLKYFKPSNSSFSSMESIINLDWGGRIYKHKKLGLDNDNILQYCKNLFTRKNFIRGHSIGTLSPTNVDTYPDLHPGKESHRLFAEKIVGILK